MAERLTWVIVGLILLSGAASFGALALVSGATPTGSTCDQVVRHDAFRDSSAIDSVNRTGEASSSVQNTEVRVEDVPGFVRLHADNPNGYCVKYVVEISPEIVAPADLGKISSNDESHEATWRAAQNLSSGEVYTRVTLTLPASSNATFAPSSVRVQSLSWTGEARRTGSGVLDDVREWWSSSKLEQREYEISPTDSSSRITVPLTKDGEAIESWQASYELDGEKRTVTQDASEPVYYTESAESVTFHFEENASDATVHFTAEPNPVEKVQFSAESYFSGLTRGGGWLENLPLTASPSEVVA